MKRNKRIALVLSLLAAISLLFGGCSINLRLTDASSQAEETKQESPKTNSELAEELASQLNQMQSELDAQSETDKQESGTAAVYTMADIAKLNNTQNFAKNTLEHIFDGTINSKGNATGYHYTGVIDSKGELIAGTESEKDEHGVFTGKVTVDGVKKNGFSSFYPESWTPQQVVDAINEAYEYALNDNSNPHGELWIGYSGDLEIDMYLNNNKKITTAFPIYEGD